MAVRNERLDWQAIQFWALSCTNQLMGQVIERRNARLLLQQIKNDCAGWIDLLLRDAFLELNQREKLKR